MSDTKRLVDMFTEKAKLTSAFVSKVKSMDEAFAYTLDVCDKKEACQLLLSGCEGDLSQKADNLCGGRPAKIIAAPGLDAADAKTLGALCLERGVHFITEGMRKNLGGVDIGFTVADAGIADTGTLVLDSKSEEQRLATMIAEVHICVLRVKDLYETSFDAEPLLRSLSKNPPAYVAFVTGASRTSDIERVLALGVHGPLELHILLLED